MESMRVEFEFPQSQGLQNILELTASLEKLENQVKETDKVVQTAEDHVKELGTTADGAKNKVNQLGDKSKEAGEQMRDAGEKGAAGMRKVNEETSLVDQQITKSIASVKNWIAGFASIQGVVQLIQLMNNELQKTLEAQNALANQRIGVDNMLQSMLVNLGIANTAQGQAQVRGIMSQLRQLAPGATNQMISAMVGSAQSFQYDVTQAGSAGQQIFGTAAGFASSMGLDPRSSGDLFRLGAAVNARTPESFSKMLAQIRSAQQSTGIENPAEFMSAFLRLGAQYVPQGFTLDQIGGMLSGSAIGTTSAEIAATRAEQSLRAIAGRDVETQSAGARKMMEAGYLSEADVSRAAGSVVVSPEELASRSNRQIEADRRKREASDTENQIKERENTFNNSQRSRQRQLASLRKRAAEGDPDAAERAGELERQIEQEQRNHELSIKDQRQRVADLTQGAQAIEGQLTQSTRTAALAAAYRAMPAGRRYQAVRDMTAGMTAIQQREFFRSTLGATEEEANALQVSFGEAGRKASDVTGSAMANPDIAGMNTDIKGYAESPIGRDVQTRESSQLSAAGVVTDIDTEVARMVKSGESRYQTVAGLWDRMSDKQRAMSGMVDLSSEASANVQIQRDAMNMMIRFISTMTTEEHAAYPQLEGLLREMSSASPYSFVTNAQWRAFIERTYRKFLQVVEKLKADRAGGKFTDRTNIPVLTQQGPRGFSDDKSTQGINEGLMFSTDPNVKGIGEVDMIEEFGGKDTGPKTIGGGQSRVYINVGSYIVQPDDEIDLVGRMEGKDLA